MHASLAQWGNSLAIRIPKAVAEQLNLSAGSDVNMEVSGAGLVITAARPRYTLEELVALMTPENLPDETFDVRPVGAEVVEWDPM